MDNKEIKQLCDEWVNVKCSMDCNNCDFEDFCNLIYNFTRKLNHEIYEVKEEISDIEKQVKEFCFKLQTILNTLGYKDIIVNFVVDSKGWKGWVRIFIISNTFSFKTRVYNYTKLSLIGIDTNYELLYLSKQFLERKVLNE